MIINDCFKVRSLILTAAMISGLGFVTHATAQPRSFLVDLNTRTVTPLGTLGGIDNSGNSSSSQPFGINDAGRVVGYSLSIEGNEHAFITGPNGVGIRDLGTLGGAGSHARGINDAGQVVGRSNMAGGANHAFITAPDGIGMRDLGTLGGHQSDAWGINNAGQVVGWSATAEGFDHAFITGPDGVGMRDLGTLNWEGPHSYALGINDPGQVVGWSYIGGPSEHAFITGPDGAGLRDLGTLGGIGRWDSTHSLASDINNAGHVVGSSLSAEGTTHAFITGPDGMGMKDLGTLGDIDSVATA